MSEETTTTATFYEARRKSRGQIPPEARETWKKRIIWICVACAAGAGLFTLGWVGWRVTHVRAVKASVCGAVIDLASNAAGRVLEEKVKPGDTVRKGQELAILDNHEAVARLQALEALRDVKESALAQAQTRLKLAQDASEAELELARARVEAARARFESVRAGVGISGARLSEQLRRAEAQYAEARAQMDLMRKGSRNEDVESSRARLEAAKATLELSNLELKQTQSLFDQGIESERNLEAARTRVKTQETRVREAELELKRLVSGATAEEREMTRQEMMATSASLSLARTESDQRQNLSADVRAQEALLREAEAGLKQAVSGQAGVVLAQAQVKSALAELKAAKADVASQQAVVDEMTLRSPVDGQVSRSFIDEGDLCQKGTVCYQIVDTSKGLWIECFVRERDAEKLQVGNKARVEIVRGSDDWISAKVESIGMTTSSLDPNGSPAAPSAAASSTAVPEQVWVKLRPTERLNSPIPGMSARAVIRAK